MELDVTGRLAAIEEIRQLKARYCRLIDEKNWAALETDLDDELSVEIAGAPGGADDLQRFDSRSTFLGGLKALMGPLVTVHHVHAPEIEILSETAATGIWAVADRLTFPEGSPLHVLQGYGHYRETYRKRSGRWVLQSLRLTRILVEEVHSESLAGQV